jgi:23S rRNA pseudouridine2605 synthase
MIFQQELDGLRHQKWRVHAAAKERPLRTLDDAREFLNSVGFCLMYPVKPPLVAPTFIGAYLSTKDNLPLPAQALLDSRAKEAELLTSRLLSEKAAFEVGFANDGVLLVSSSEFPYFYALIGDRNPKLPPNAGARGEKALLTHTFETIQQHGPVNELEIRERLGRSISDTAVVRAVHDLWSHLRVVRVSDHADGSSRWDVLYRWAPEQVNAGKQMSAREALSALISKYLETVIAADQKDVEDFFSPMVPRSRVAEVIRAMQGAREFSHVQVAGKMLLCLAARGEEISDLNTIGSAREKETAALEKIQAADLKFRQKRDNAKKFERRSAEKSNESKPHSSAKPFEKKPSRGPKKFASSRPDKKFDKKRSAPAKSLDPKRSHGARKTFAAPRRSQP